MNSPVRVFHLEDYKIIRDGIRFLLEQDKDILVVGEAQNGEEFFRMLPAVEMDVLIMDIYLDAMEDRQHMDGFAICREIRESQSPVRVIAHSVYDDADRVTRMMKAGATGFVSKKSGYEELIAAVKAVAQGRKFICNETSKKFRNTQQFLAGLDDTLKGEKDIFSAREKVVLELLSKGYSTKHIAKELFITEKTVETHRKNMADKARVKNTPELIAFASSRGYIKH